MITLWLTAHFFQLILFSFRVAHIWDERRSGFRGFVNKVHFKNRRGEGPIGFWESVLKDRIGFLVLDAWCLYQWDSFWLSMFTSYVMADTAQHVLYSVRNRLVLTPALVTSFVQALVVGVAAVYYFPETHWAAYAFGTSLILVNYIQLHLRNYLR